MDRRARIQQGQCDERALQRAAAQSTQAPPTVREGHPVITCPLFIFFVFTARGSHARTLVSDCTSKTP